MNTHGGKRKGSGAKLKYGEPTEVKSFRLPISLIEPVTKYIEKLLKTKRK